MQVASMRRHWKLMEVVLLQPMEVLGRADSHLQPRGKLTLEQKDVPKGGFDLLKSLKRSRVLWHYGEETKLEQFMRNHSLWQGLTLEKFTND